MAIIYSYPLNTPKREDLLIGTVTYDENAQDPVVGNPTVSFTVGSLLDLVAAQGAAQNLQQVTNIGNTTTNSIVISNSLKVAGGYYDSSNQPGTAGQILSSTATGTQWVNVAAQGVTSVGLSMPTAFTVTNSPITQSGTLTVTGAGTAAQYINGLGNLVTFPTIPAPYVLPVATTVALGGIKIGYTETGKNYPLELDNEQAYVNVPWTDTVYTLPLATDGTRGGVQIGYVENAKNYPVELSSEKMFVNVPWTDTTYTLPVATATDLGGVKIGYTENAKNYPVELDSDQMYVNVPWTDTQTVQTITGTGSDNTNSGISLSNSGGTVLILGSGSVAASQSGNTITLTGVNTWVANSLNVAGYVAAPGAVANKVWKTDASGNPAWRDDANTDTGITGVTLATGTSTGSPLSESIANRELTLTSFEYDGGSNIGYVPTGGTSTTYLKGDGTWAAIPTGLQFKGTWDASGGGGGNPDLTQGANKGAGFLWICDVAGTAYPNGGTNPPSTWNLGDWAVYDGTAWTRVPATNSGVTSLTTTDGAFIDLTPNTATTGAITVTADLSAQDGTSDTTTRFLSKDNTWDVPSYSDPGVTTFTNENGTFISAGTVNTNATGAVTTGIIDLSATGTKDSTTFLRGDNTWDIPPGTYTLPVATTTVLGGIELGSDTALTQTYETGVTGTANRTYPVQLNTARQAAVSVPWVNTQENTTWTVRDSADADKTVNNNKFLKFVTATGALGTALTGTGSTSDPYIMTLTSPNTNTTYSAMTTSTLGLGKIRYDFGSTPAAEAQSETAGRTYGVTKNASDQLVVNVPWTDNESYNWTIKDNATNPASSVVDSGETIQFVTATGPLGTVLTEPTAGNFVMTLTSPDTNTTYNNFTGADGTNAGASGLVPAPAATDNGKFLKGDGTWATTPQGDITEIKVTAPITGAATSGIATIGIDTMGAATANTAGTKGAVPASAAGDQLKFLRADATWVVPTDTNTWVANSKLVAGYVAAPGAVASKVWKTDANGNPAWRDDATGDNTTYTIGSGNTKIITLTGSDSSTSTVTFADGADISISGNNGTITITNDSPDSGLPAVLTDGNNPGVTSLYANTTAAAVRATIGAGTGNGIVTSLTTTGTSGASTLTNGVLNVPNYADGNDNDYLTALAFNTGDGVLTATVQNQSDVTVDLDGRYLLLSGGSLTGDLQVTNEITVNKTDVNTPGKITINGNTDATLQLKSEDTALAANETLGVIEFYGSDGTSPGAGVKSSIRARNGDQTGGTGNKSNLIFAVSPGNAANNTEKMRINPTGSIAFNGATNYGTSGQLLQSNGDASPTWVNPPTTGVTGSGTTNTVPRWASSSSLGDGPLTFSQNATATWESADTIMGGRLEVGSEGTNSVDSRIAIGAPTGNEAYLYFNSSVPSAPADTRTYSMGIDASDSRNFKFTQGTSPSNGNERVIIQGGSNNGVDNNIYLKEGYTRIEGTNDEGGVLLIGQASTSTSEACIINMGNINHEMDSHILMRSKDTGTPAWQNWIFGLDYNDKHFKIGDGVVLGGNNTYLDIDPSGNIGLGTESPSGKFHVKVGTSTPFIVASSNYCNNVGIRTTTPTASLQVKGNVSYSYVNYTNVANTWVNVISMAGYPTGLYQISIIKKTNASTYVTAIIKWDNSGSGSGTIANTITSNQLSVSFNNTTTLQAISGISTGTLMSANLQLLVTNEDSCS